MTREQLLDAVGDIRDAFIREAAPPPASYRKQREFPWTGAVAACLALMIVGSTFFLSQMNMGDGATGSGGASAATEDTAEVGESGGTVNGASDGTDDSEPETAAITVTVDGTVYVQAGGVGRHPEACQRDSPTLERRSCRTPGSFVPTMPTRSGRGRSMSIRAAGMRGPEPPIWPMSATRRRQQTDRGRKEKAGPLEGIPAGGLLRMILPVLTAASAAFSKIPRPWAERPRHQR